MSLNISAWSIRHPLPSVVFSIILLALGWISFTKLAVTRLPAADIPVISVAVVIDTPRGDYYGTTVSAPVFAEVAQQVLEYLGVPHDIDIKPATKTKPEKPAAEDDSSEDDRGIQALYEAANDLPIDDPLRGNPEPQTAPPAGRPAPAPQQSTSTTSAPPAANAPSTPQTVTIGDSGKVRVPALTGLSIRKVIEQSAAAGLEVQIVGNGTCRQQAPNAGAMVAPNTKIVVRCGR